MNKSQKQSQGDVKKNYGLSSINNKLKKSEPNTFANYYVDLGEMFNDQSEYTK